MSFRVVSLGWGCQSFALAAMAALGELPPIDAAVFADTTHERTETYVFAQKYTPWLEAHGVRVVTVHGSRTDAVKKPSSGVLIPAFTRRENGTLSGMLRRQCTGYWKIAPIRRWLQANRCGEPVELWLGITLDEVSRVKPSNVKYITNVYPFIEHRITRHDVIYWLNAHGLKTPPKSACVFCPFHDRAQWRELKISKNGDWQRAVEVDEIIRHKRPGYTAYLNAQRIPLVEMDLGDEQDYANPWDDECTGYCGV